MKKLLLTLLMLCALALTACTAPTAPKGCADLRDAILASQAFSENMTEQTEKRMNKALFLEEGMISEGVMTLDASRATAETIIVLTAASDETLPKVKALVQEYLDALTMQYRDYRPAEVPKLEAASVQVKGRQVVLIIAPDQQKALDALNGVW